MIQDKHGETYTINCGQPSMGLLKVSPSDYYKKYRKSNCNRQSFLEYLGRIPKYSDAAEMGYKVVKFSLSVAYQGQEEEYEY